MYAKTSGGPSNPRGGPELWLQPKQALLPSGERVQLKPNGFRWTPESMSRAIRVFRNVFGGLPENMSGDVVLKNLAIFQKSFAEIRVAHPQ